VQAKKSRSSLKLTIVLFGGVDVELS